MTTVERFSSTQPHLFPNATNNVQQPHPTPNAIRRTKHVPPAVPSPPRYSARNSPPRRPPRSDEREEAFIMAVESPNQWLFTETELLHTPSVLAGIPIAEERARRAKGVNFIMQAGILLKLPQLTLATASVFFHRFFMRYSMDGVGPDFRYQLHHYVGSSHPASSSSTYNLPLVPRGLPRSKAYTNLKAKDHRVQSLMFESLEQNAAATALFLATKTEESCRKTKEIVVAVAKVAAKNASLLIDEQSKEYWRWRDNILINEELMLEMLTFDLVLESPYNFLYQFLQQLHIEDNKSIRNNAWAILNDSCLTILCLAMPAKHIAIAALYFAAKFTGEKISDGKGGQPWWEQLGGSEDLIVKAVNIMYEFYSENPLKKDANPYAKTPDSNASEDLDITRRRKSLSQEMSSQGEEERKENGKEHEKENGKENEKENHNV
jgi:protein BUR2